MVEKIPNDVFQFSLLSAYSLGLDSSGPLVAQLSGYGSHGIGRLHDSDLVLIDGRPYEIDSSFNAKPAHEIAQLPFVMVTRFEPRYRAKLAEGSNMASLSAFLRNKDGQHGGQNSMMPLSLSGTFASVSVRGTGGKTQRLEGVTGTMFGYSIPTWGEAISGKGVRITFAPAADSAGQKGGVVEDFETSGQVGLDWAVTGRFHLGLPSGPSFESLDLPKAPQ